MDNRNDINTCSGTGCGSEKRNAESILHTTRKHVQISITPEYTKEAVVHGHPVVDSGYVSMENLNSNVKNRDFVFNSSVATPLGTDKRKSTSLDNRLQKVQVRRQMNLSSPAKLNAMVNQPPKDTGSPAESLPGNGNSPQSRVRARYKGLRQLAKTTADAKDKGLPPSGVQVQQPCPGPSTSTGQYNSFAIYNNTVLHNYNIYRI